MIYKPGFDIITTIEYFESRPMDTFRKVALRKEARDGIRAVLSDYTSCYLGVDVLRGSNRLEMQ